MLMLIQVAELLLIWQIKKQQQLERKTDNKMLDYYLKKRKQKTSTKLRKQFATLMNVEAQNCQN